VSAAARPWAGAAGVCLGLAALSALVGPTTPTYDPWAWLIWGREIGHLDLDTVDGPAFKPLPVLVTILLTPLGDGAATAWVVLARAGGLAAIAAAALLAHRLAGGPGMPPGAYVLPAAPPGTRDLAHRRAADRAALLAAVATATTTGLVWHAWQGESEGLAAAFALLALERGVAGRHRAALTLAVAASLVRVEAWPFLVLYAAWLWRTRPAWRPALAAIAVGVPLLWFAPELWGSGDLLRSGTRARIPNPGQPAEADVPLLASLGDAVTLPLLGVLAAIGVGLATVRSGVALPAAAGGAWIALVAVMAQAGFSGESRYHVPGAVALGVAGAVAVAGTARRRAPRWAAVAGVLTLLLGGQAVARAVGGIPGRWDRATHQERLTDDLREVIARAGGRQELLRCGRPVTGRYRGPLLAWHLRVHKRRIGFDPRAAGTGAVFSSRLVQDAAVEPAVAGGRARVVRAGLWTVTRPTRC